MDYQVFFIISLVVLALLAIYTFTLYRDRDKYLFAYKPIQRERDKLKEELDKVKALASSDKLDDKNGKSEKNRTAASSEEKSESCGAEAAELRDKIRTLKADIAKLKEENFSIRKDNKNLRQEIRDHANHTDSGQREIVDLRALKDDLENELKNAREQIATLEKRVSDTANEKTAESLEKSSQDEAAIDRLQKENASLAASLKDVRSELAAYKRDFKSQIDAAKKAVSDAGQPIKKELARANKLCEQAKKRAANNHKIYLVARAQLVLAEKKLQVIDASYKPTWSLPISNDAIDEMIKKIDTVGARASKATNDVLDMQKEADSLRKKMAELEAENKALAAQNAELKAADDENKARLAAQSETVKVEKRDISFSSFEDDLNISDDSLTSLIANVAEKRSDDVGSDEVKVSKSKSLVDLDFGEMDDDWA